MADLIDQTRAERNLAYTGTAVGEFTDAQEALINALIAAGSRAIKKHCGRQFDSQTFDELYDGHGQAELLLREFPILSIARIAYAPTAVLRITNTSATNQRATVSVTSTGLTLVRVASGTATTSTIAFADQATITALATAITALGNGWSGTVVDSRHNLRASADLRAVQGALNAKDVHAHLLLHTAELSSYEVDANAGILTRSLSELADLQDECNEPIWYGGRCHWRVIYTAGYATVPEDVQEACAQWVQHHYALANRNPQLGNTFSASTGSTYLPQTGMPENVNALLEPYRKRRL